MPSRARAKILGPDRTVLPVGERFEVYTCGQTVEVRVESEASDPAYLIAEFSDAENDLVVHQWFDSAATRFVDVLALRKGIVLVLDDWIEVLYEGGSWVGPGDFDIRLAGIQQEFDSSTLADIHALAGATLSTFQVSLISRYRRIMQNPDSLLFDAYWIVTALEHEYGAPKDGHCPFGVKGNLWKEVHRVAASVHTGETDGIGPLPRKAVGQGHDRDRPVLRSELSWLRGILGEIITRVALGRVEPAMDKASHPPPRNS